MSQVRTLILGLLARGEMYGYQIKKTLESDAYRDWATVPSASLYAQLARMSDEGLIVKSGVEAAQGRPARNVYQITDQGGLVLQDLLRDAWQETALGGVPQDAAASFIDLLPEDELAALLDRRLEHLEDELVRIEHMSRSYQAQPGPGLALDAVWRHLAGRVRIDIEWTLNLKEQLVQGAFRSANNSIVPAPIKALKPRNTPGQAAGAFTFVLHSHLPYCRRAGMWPHGEEWLHEALAETYIPLLMALYDLRDEGIDFRLTIGITPVLTEQLADADIKAHFVTYLDQEIASAEADIPRFGEEGDEHAEYLATFYRDYYRKVHNAFLDRFKSDVIGAFRQLQDEGLIEIICSAATHGYLPLLGRDSSIYGQLRTGIASYMRHFGKAPRAIWLPECAYRPAFVDDDGTVRPGIEEFLSAQGITCFFVETHAIEGGMPVGKAAGETAIGPYGMIKRHYVIPMAESNTSGGTTFSAYWVMGNTNGLVDPPVAAIGRNNRTGQQVWSADWGYPGDQDYREFHQKDPESGLQYWRVTGPRTELGSKDWYHPDWAENKVMSHAKHYASLVHELLVENHEKTGQYGLVASNYDTELFGHWWFEGVTWIREVLRNLAEDDEVDLVTASEYLEINPPEEVMALPESSWGAGGTHWTWDNDDTHWVWEPIHAAETRMERLCAEHPDAIGDERWALDQAARELLLLESSDWPFLITTGQAKEYAIERFESHVVRFNQLADAVEHADIDTSFVEELYELDKVFLNIDYRWFSARQGRVD